MHIVKIEVFEDRRIKCENITAGTTGENEATKLKFIIPEDYKDFYKYIDILKSDGTKTQTVVGDMESNIFYYTLPYQLTCNGELILQLILKKGNIVFKSNIFSLYFGISVDGTQVLMGDYQDTIEFLMENKTSKEETEKIRTNLNNKLNRSEFYSANDNINVKISEKLSLNDFEDYKLKNQKAIDLKVDKISGKGLSTEDYTTEEKQKLNSLDSILADKADKLDISEIRDEISEFKKDIYSAKLLDIDDRIGNLNQSVDWHGSEIRRLANATDDIDSRIGNIENALDSIIEIQNTLIGGDSE